MRSTALPAVACRIRPFGRQPNWEPDVEDGEVGVEPLGDLLGCSARRPRHVRRSSSSAICRVERIESSSSTTSSLERFLRMETPVSRILVRAAGPPKHHEQHPLPDGGHPHFHPYNVPILADTGHHETLTGQGLSDLASPPARPQGNFTILDVREEPTVDLVHTTLSTARVKTDASVTPVMPAGRRPMRTGVGTRNINR